MGGKIDVVVGTGDLPLFWKDGQPKKFSAEERLTAINTMFGWTISGFTSARLGVSMKLELVENDNNKLFQQMYQLEQVPRASTLTPEEQSATQQVEQSIKQYNDGRYSCRLSEDYCSRPSEIFRVRRSTFRSKLVLPGCIVRKRIQ